MSGRVVVVVVVTTVVLLLAVTEAIIVTTQPFTRAPNYGNCSETLELVPVLRLVTPASTTSPTPPSDTSTLPLPQHTTTQTLLYTQPHGTTPPLTTPITTKHSYKSTTSTPTLLKPIQGPKYEHTLLYGKLKATQYPQKHNTGKLDKTHHFLTTMQNKPLLPSNSSESTRFSNTFFSTSTKPVPPVLDILSRPNLPLRITTLPPPSPILPLPTAPPLSSTTPVPLRTLQQVGEMMKHLHKKLPLVLLGWSKEQTQEFQKPYLHRIRAVNHEIVDKILQTDYEEYDEPSTANTTNTCHRLEKRMAHLYQRQTLLTLFLQALPQSLEEVEDAIWNPEITDYIFRPERKAVFDVFSCRECYALDSSGVCREVFFCKNGDNVFSRTSRRRPIVG